MNKLVESALHAAAVEDAAYDFIETEVGANYFPDNWPKYKQATNPKVAIQEWLEYVGLPYNPEDLLSVIEQRAAENKRWITPFTQPVQSLHGLH